MAAAIDTPSPDIPKAEILHGIGAAEMQRLQAMLGNGKRQKALIRVNEVDKTETVTGDVLDPMATVVFKGCINGVYVIEDTCTKVMLDSCINCQFDFKGKIVTHMVEAYKCETCTFSVNTRVKTFQTDMSRGIHITYGDPEDFHQIIWAGTHDLSLGFADGERLETGFQQMAALPQFAELREDIDQFIIRVINGKLLSEKMVRLENGFPSTVRETEEFERRQEENMRAAARSILGEDIIIPKRKTGKPKVGRNEICPCGSGKKAKKCMCDTVELT